MSAFVVNTDHIDFMLQAATHYRDVYFEFEDNPAPVWYDNATEVGRALLAENIKSVAYLYDEPERDAEYEYNGSRAGMPDLEAVNVISAIRCYMYQSCEHPRWQESAAYRFCEQLTLAAIRHLPGYDDAPWEVTREKATVGR